MLQYIHFFCFRSTVFHYHLTCERLHRLFFFLKIIIKEESCVLSVNSGGKSVTIYSNITHPQRKNEDVYQRRERVWMSQGIGKWSRISFPSLVISFHSAEITQDRRWAALWRVLHASLGTSGLRTIPGRQLSKSWKLVTEFPYVVFKWLADKKW